MNFETWWEAKATEKVKEEARLYYGLNRDTIEHFAKQAGIDNDMTINTEMVIRTIIPDNINPAAGKIEFIFEWVDDGNNQTLFSKSLGIFDMDDDGTGKGLIK
jgi:hypothetical protein